MAPWRGQGAGHLAQVTLHRLEALLSLHHGWSKNGYDDDDDDGDDDAGDDVMMTMMMIT